MNYIPHNTRNPVPSVDPRDREDNSANLDTAMNSNQDSFKSRMGEELLTYRALHNTAVRAQAEVDPVVANAKQVVEQTKQAGVSQINQEADSAKAQINKSATDTDNAAKTSLQAMAKSVSDTDAIAKTSQQTMTKKATELGDDLNNKKFTTYAEMLKSPQTRDAVVAVVDGDPDANLNGWYAWRSATKSWVRFVRDPLMEDTGFSQETIFAILDSLSRETWLGVNSVDGGPSRHAERLLRLMLNNYMANRTGYLYAVTDADGRMTDIAVRDTDGQLDDFVLDRLAPRVNSRIVDKINITGRTGYLYAFTDSDGRMTDLCVDDVTGQFPPFVIERMAKRMAPYQQSSGWLKSDLYTNGAGETFKALASKTSWSGWGSSTIDEWSELSGVAAAFGAAYYNGGNGATELQHNLAQMGARPALLLPAGGVIPESGQVVVTCSNVNKNQFFKATAGTLQGVAGTLTCTVDDWIFTRSQSGAAVAVASEQPFVPVQGILHRGDTWIMQEGKNNINNNTPIEQIIAWHRLAYSWNSALRKRVLVVTQVGNNGWAGSEGLRNIQRLNDFIKAEYPGNIFDLQAYLCSSAVWTDTGITPTADDLQNQAAGCLAASLSRDNLAHMNAKARTAAANKLKSQLIEMEWFAQ